VQNKHETYPRRNNTANEMWEDSGRHPKSWEARGRQVGLAGRTLAPTGAPLLGFWPPFWNLPPPPPRSHLGRLLSRFDPSHRAINRRLDLSLEVARSRDEESEH